MIKALRKLTRAILRGIFGRKNNLKIGFYGPPNVGKTSLANLICKDWNKNRILFRTVSEQIVNKIENMRKNIS